MGIIINIGGKVFGRLTAIEFVGIKNNNASWKCICECGITTIVRGTSLRMGRTRSCGCITKEQMSTHGLSNIPEYLVWNTMIQRCTNKRQKSYKDYGLRGIVVCSRWKEFVNFFEDMGHRPSKRHTIERIDNNGNYEPDNCTWKTQIEQVRNKRIHKKNKSGVSGARKVQNGKYSVTIGVNYKRITIGTFDTLKEAAQARRKAEIKYWGK